MNKHVPTIFPWPKDVAFTIECGDNKLPAVWLPPQFEPTACKAAGVKVRYLSVLGYYAKSGTIKSIPAKAGLAYAIKSGWTGRGKKILTESSGNFLASLKDAIDERDDIELDLIGIISSKLPAGKRADLGRRDIDLMTELDLARELGLEKPVDSFTMVQMYSERYGIPNLDQYNCDYQGGWNRLSYKPIADEVYRQLGDTVSLFDATAGTKGKFRGVGVELKAQSPRTEIVITFPYPGYAFPGGRDEEHIEKVRNSFGTDALIRRRTDLYAAYERAKRLFLAGIPAGITFAAELATAEHRILELLSEHRLETIMGPDRVVTVLLVASDSIYPYLGEMREFAPHVFNDVVDPRFV